MNKGFVFTLGLMIGGAIGGITTWSILKTKYERLAKAEIEEVREYYATKDNADISIILDDDEDVNASENQSIKEEYQTLVYAYSPEDTKEEGGEKPVRREPYVISPAEFGEMTDYECITLVYYNDGILADSDNNMIEDIESCIGYESLNHFGEYGEDSVVYVRNEDAMTDYEVVLDETDYADLEGIG